MHLTDPALERRFVLRHVPLQRRTTLGALIFVVALTAAELVYRAIVDRDRLTVADVLVLAVALVAGLALVAGMWRDHSPKRDIAMISATGLVLPALVGAVVLAGIPVASQGTLLLVGGVIVVYMPARLDFPGIVGAGLAYSAVTVPFWLASGVATSTSDIVYTLGAVVAAHVLGIIEARRALGERRAQFAITEEYERLSSIDPLTTLTNRRAFARHLDETWRVSRAYGSPLALLMLDIDHFKHLNDSRGHASGDVALRVVGDTIRESLPAAPAASRGLGARASGGEPIAARYGGEEFAVLLPGLGTVEAIAIAESIRSRLRAVAIPVIDSLADPIDDATGILTISIGAVATDSALDISTAAELVNAADRELYRAKNEGRDRVRAPALKRRP